MYCNRHKASVRVFPRNDQGKREAERMFGIPLPGQRLPAQDVYFCPSWERSDVPDRCANRDPRRLGNHNLCRYCPGGYLLEGAISPERIDGVNRRDAGIV